MNYISMCCNEKINCDDISVFAFEHLFHFYFNVILNILQMNQCSVQVTRYIFLKGMMGMYSKRLFFSLINSGLYLKKRMSFAHILPFPANIFTRPHTIRRFLFAMDKK